jgi:hypothetical protein
LLRSFLELGDLGRQLLHGRTLDVTLVPRCANLVLEIALPIENSCQALADRGEYRALERRRVALSELVGPGVAFRLGCLPPCRDLGLARPAPRGFPRLGRGWIGDVGCPIFRLLPFPWGWRLPEERFGSVHDHLSFA